MVIQHRRPVGMQHLDRRTNQPSRLRDVREAHPAIIPIQNVVVTMMARVVEPNEVLVQPVTYEYIQIAVVVNIPARHADGRAQVDRISKRRICNILEPRAINVA